MNSLTNVSSYSSSLNEFPLNSQGINYTAQALGLTDLKSITLNLLMEQMGLAEPERYTWTLHERGIPTGGKCPLDVLYLVVQRNYDPVPSQSSQSLYSPYVNGTLYSYLIEDFCKGTPTAITVPFPVDPFAETYTAVASFNVQLGGFYGGLTRDDVGGIRSLLRTNNINWETAPNNSLLLTTTTNLAVKALFPANNAGTNATGGFGTLDLGVLLATAHTNDPATLQGLYPGLIFNLLSNDFVLASNITVVSYFTNYVGEAIGTPPHQKFATNYTQFPLQIYYYSFYNIVTNHYHANTAAKLVTTTVAPPVGSTIGSPSKTTVKIKNITLTNTPSGDFYILDPLLCPVNILSTFQVSVSATTNILVNTGTNGVLTTTTNTLSYTQSIVTYFTNYTYKVHPVTCAQVPAGTGLYQGIENIKFMRASYDSLIGQFFQPVTNNYTMVMVTNSQAIRQKFQRIVTAPDFLLTAQDMAGTILGFPVVPYAARNLTFDQANVLPGLAGPGTIVSPTVFTFDKVGNAFDNGSLFFNGLATNAFLSEFTQSSALTYASFDGSTNDPVLYPNGNSIANLENQMLIQISPTSLTDSDLYQPYPETTFTATGGAFTPPYTWLATGLPDGLTLSSDGTLSGIPTQAGTFDITIQLDDAAGRTVQWFYSITIQ
jgi:hypothetical protein